MIKLVNRLERNSFMPYVVTIRGFDAHTLTSLSDDVQFRAFQRREGRDWSVVGKLATYFLQNQIDIVHSHNWETFLYSFLAARAARIPVFIHGEHGRDTKEVFDGWVKRKVKAFLAWQSSRLTTVSEDIAEMIIEQ